MDTASIPRSGSHATSNRPLGREFLWSRIPTRRFAGVPHRIRSQPLTIPPSYSRYVALKFMVAELTGRNNEVKIYNHLASRSGTHPGSDRVLAPLDHFKVQGPNGEHDVLAFQVVGPHLEDMLNADSPAVRRAIKSIAYQIALGISFLHDCGVVHGGQSTLPSISQQFTGVISRSAQRKCRVRDPKFRREIRARGDEHLELAGLCTSVHQRPAVSIRFTP